MLVKRELTMSMGNYTFICFIYSNLWLLTYQYSFRRALDNWSPSVRMIYWKRWKHRRKKRSQRILLEILRIEVNLLRPINNKRKKSLHLLLTSITKGIKVHVNLTGLRIRLRVSLEHIALIQKKMGERASFQKTIRHWWRLKNKSKMWLKCSIRIRSKWAKHSESRRIHSRSSSKNSNNSSITRL